METDALIILPGHPDRRARLRVVRDSALSRAGRTAMYAALWIGGSVATFFITIFDPFMTSLPFLVGAMATYRSWRGTFRVLGFQGACPRCETEIELRPGARIASPHGLVCYQCHFEPRLHLAG